jgi:nitrogen fixation protein NifX
MSSSPLSKDIALRIALAARVLPDTDPARLLKVLDDATGLPPSKKKLEKLNLKTFKSACDGEFADIETNALKQALEILSGSSNEAQEDFTLVLDAYEEGDMPGSLRIACASNNGEELDGHFGSCRRFLVYQVSMDEIRLIDARKATGPESRDDKNIYRTELIKDCQVLFISSIGGPAAAKVVKAGVHPVKYPAGGSARERIEALQKIISNAPPPWLAKAMGQNAESRVRFERNEAEV